VLVADGVPLIVNEEPVAVPVTPVGKLPPFMEIVAELVAVYTIVVIAVPVITLWLAAPPAECRVIVGIGFIVASTAVRAADKQPAEVRACV
jgi:hypothetical protein